MPERRWTDADHQRVVDAIYDPLPGDPTPDPQLNRTGARLHAKADRVLDALTAAGWRPPPPEPDGVHWRVGGSVGRTVYGPYGDLVGLMDSPELAAAFVAAMNAEVDRG